MQPEIMLKHFLLPATIFAEPQPYLVDTILGSCVAVCLFDPHLHFGGMNHYMLPLWNGNGLASPKYGNIAIEKLVEKMLRAGSVKSQLVAKIFGGANQMNTAMNVGERNVEIAREELRRFGIPIVAESIGGTVGRKIRFDTGSGQVLMKMLNKPEEPWEK